MAETTSDEVKMARGEAAAYLRSIADELASEGGSVGVPIRNKEVHLTPPETINLETTVTERSRRLRSDTEELSLVFKWNPTRRAVESGPKTESGSDL